jgi:hypothetical protein
VNVLVRINVDSVHIEMTVLGSRVDADVIHMLGVLAVSILVVPPRTVLQPGKNMSGFMDSHILFGRQAIIRPVLLDKIVDEVHTLAETNADKTSYKQAYDVNHYRVDVHIVSYL